MIVNENGLTLYYRESMMAAFQARKETVCLIHKGMDLLREVVQQGLARIMQPIAPLHGGLMGKVTHA
jgi:hypothetical protein